MSPVETIDSSHGGDIVCTKAGREYVRSTAIISSGACGSVSTVGFLSFKRSSKDFSYFSDIAS